MTNSSHLQALQRKHTDLQNELDRLIASPGAEDSEIAEVKRKKLMLKDEISRLVALDSSRSEDLHSQNN